MAVVTTRFATMGTSFLEATYDDVTLDLTSARVVVGDTPVRVQIWRNSNNVWREGTFTEPGETVFNAGGPVRNLSNVPFWSFGSI